MAIITREVLAAYPSAGVECSVCGSTNCEGHCVENNPDGAREFVTAGADRLTARLGI